LIFAEAVAMALAEKIGKDQAHEIVREASQRAVKEKEHLRVVLPADERVKKHLSGADLERLFEGRNYLGAAEEFVTRVVAASRGKRRIR
jgi:3-carboxy-cis,cis-muconate cycloisomerase